MGLQLPYLEDGKYKKGLGLLGRLSEGKNKTKAEAILHLLA